MKVLHLLRHAKSDWSDLSLSDHARPLNDRGRKAAKEMGCRLADEDVDVDRIFCSTAQRARETLARTGACFRKIPVSYHDALYLVSAAEVLDFIRQAPESTTSVLLIGHNPATHDLALSLIARAARGQRAALLELERKYPTGSLCTIRFNASRWRQIAPGTGTLLRFLRPRDLAHPPPIKPPGKKVSRR